MPQIAQRCSRVRRRYWRAAWGDGSTPLAKMRASYVARWWSWQHRSEQKRGLVVIAAQCVQGLAAKRPERRLRATPRLFVRAAHERLQKRASLGLAEMSALQVTHRRFRKSLRPESNRYTWITNPVFYQLNYRGVYGTVTLCTNFRAGSCRRATGTCGILSRCAIRFESSSSPT